MDPAEKKRLQNRKKKESKKKNKKKVSESQSSSGQKLNLLNERECSQVIEKVGSCPSLDGIYLNLSSFWEAWLESNPSPTAILFKAVQKSQGSLREIKLVVEGSNEDDDEDEDALPFVFSLIKVLMKGFDSLRLIEIEAPVYLTLKTGNITTGSKRFSLSHNGPDFKLEREDSTTTVLPTIRAVRAFTRTGFTEILIGLDDSLEEDHEQAEVWEELIKEPSSKTTLQKLDLHSLPAVNGRILWDFAVSCPNLTHLNLHCMSFASQDAEPEPLVIPQDLQIGKLPLKTLRLDILAFKVDWTAVAKWVGNEIEDLSLSPGGDSDEEDGVASQILFNSRLSVKDLKLQSLQFDPEEHLQSSSFPKLEIASLWFIKEDTWKYFSKIKSPKLREIEIHAGGGENLLPSIFEISKTHGSTLKDLTITWVHSINPQELDPDFVFTSLERLHLRTCGEDVIQWFSRLHYPNLFSFKTDKGNYEFKNAPKLKRVQQTENQRTLMSFFEFAAFHQMMKDGHDEAREQRNSTARAFNDGIDSDEDDESDEYDEEDID